MPSSLALGARRLAASPPAAQAPCGPVHASFANLSDSVARSAWRTGNRPPSFRFKTISFRPAGIPPRASSGLSSTPWSMASKRGRDGGEEVEIARLAVGPSQSYCGAFPKFTQPKEVACFSRSADRAVTFDRQALRPYRPPVLPAPLDVGFETYVPKSAKEEEPAPLKDVLDALAHRKVDPHAHHFVTCCCGVAKVCPSRSGPWATRRSASPPACSGSSYWTETRALAAGMPRRGCGGALVPAQGL